MGLAAHLETSVGGSDIDSESDAAASDSEAWSLAARPARASSDIATAEARLMQMEVEQDQQGQYGQPCDEIGAPSDDIPVVPSVAEHIPQGKRSDESAAISSEQASLRQQLLATQKELQVYKRETDRLRSALRQAHQSLLSPSTARRTKGQRKSQRSKQSNKQRTRIGKLATQEAWLSS